MPEIKKLETLFYNFMWDEKPDEIKREMIVQNLEDSGLNMPDVKQFIIKSLKNIVGKKISPKQCRVEFDTCTRFASF